MRDPPGEEPPGGFQAGGTPGGRWGCALAGMLLACSLPLLGIAAIAARGMSEWLRPY
jgi:hypothetical protein